jgi:hypothetical protein
MASRRGGGQHRHEDAPKELLNVGIRLIALILCETILLAALVLTFLHAAG